MFEPGTAGGTGQGTAPEARAAEGQAEALAVQDPPAAGGQAPTDDQVEPEKAADEAPASDDAAAGEDLFDEVFGDGQGDEVKDEAPPAPPPPPPVQDPADEPASSDVSKEIRLGLVDGLLYRVPIEIVQGLLGAPALERVAVLRSNPASILALQTQMRGTDGRCAPVFFTAEGDQPPVIFSGIESVAAGLELGLTHLFVVTVEPRDAGALQSYLVHHRTTAPPAEPEDDLVRRVNASWDDE